MKYSKSAIGLLTAQYRSVLKKCWMINVGLFALMGATFATPAEAAGGVEYVTTMGNLIVTIGSDEHQVQPASGSIGTVAEKTANGFV